MKKLLSLIPIFLVLVNPVLSQDTLLLLTGKSLTGRVVEVNEHYVILSEFRDGDSSQVVIEPERIFSITRAGGEEKVLYSQLEDAGRIYTPEEMRFFIYGEQDADLNYSAWPTGIGGFITGAAAGFFIFDGFPYVLAQPFVYTGINILPLISIKDKHIRSREMLKQESYVAGFERVARNRKIQSALKGSLAGMAVGIGTAILVNGAQ